MDLQDEVNRLIEEGITTGQLILANGDVRSLRTVDVMRLISLAKQSKAVSPSGVASMIPTDYFIPPTTESGMIDFNQLEQQINKSSKDD